MVYVRFPKDLEKRELGAHRMGEFEVMKRGKSKKLSDIYKEIGEDCEERGFRDKAISNYRDARKFATSSEDVDEIEKKLNPLEARSLEKIFVLPTLAIGSFVIALFFTSFSLTGYAVGGLTQESSRWFGLCLFACGLIFTFFYFKNKK